MNKQDKNYSDNSTPKYSQWKAMLAISRASLRSITRSPSAVIFILVFPLVFIVVFGFVGSNTIKLDVGINSKSDTSGFVFKSFSEVQNIHLVVDKTDREMMDLLKKGRMDAILFIHEGKSESGKETVEIITSKASREKGAFAISVLSNIIDKKNLDYYSHLQKRYPESFKDVLSDGEIPAELKDTKVEGREYKMIDFILPGQLGFSILSAGVFGTAFVFFSLRQTLVLKRFFATPIKRTYIVLGEALSRVVFQLAGALVIIVLGKYVFGFTLINGFVTVINLLLLSALGLIVFMGFGFVVSGLAPNESVIPPIANIVTLPQFLLSGTFFPVDAFPDWLQVVSKVLPLTYLNDALRKVAFEGAGMIDISHELSIIFIWGLIVYAAAVKFFRWE
ncbi:MAG: ABC transporter permease [Bacteroidetes bacterium]|nr:MAG: ABC transporter permease [Bacteroidota bacterium]